MGVPVQLIVEDRSVECVPVGFLLVEELAVEGLSLQEASTAAISTERGRCGGRYWYILGAAKGGAGVVGAAKGGGCAVGAVTGGATVDVGAARENLGTDGGLPWRPGVAKVDDDGGAAGLNGIGGTGGAVRRTYTL
ncbi:hypothetical protein O6H91_Y286500 [Diphasiastrum complanatum]|nr:hypothetical protein O6H91_Y286500 [Diphasiastrum complanatum]